MDMTDLRVRFLVSRDEEFWNLVRGDVHVGRGAVLTVHGHLDGDLHIHEGGHAIVRGHVTRNVINAGRLSLEGQVMGQLLGNRPDTPVGPEQIIGMPLRDARRADAS
jgi:hypothetical protein